MEPTLEQATPQVTDFTLEEIFALMVTATLWLYGRLGYSLPLEVKLGRGHRSYYKCKLTAECVIEHKIVYGKKAIQSILEGLPHCQGGGGWLERCVDFYAQPLSPLVCIVHLILHETAHAANRLAGDQGKPHSKQFHQVLRGFYGEGYHKEIMAQFRAEASLEVLALLDGHKEHKSTFSEGESVWFLHQERWVEGEIVHTNHELAKVSAEGVIWRIPYGMLRSQKERTLRKAA